MMSLREGPRAQCLRKSTPIKIMQTQGRGPDDSIRGAQIRSRSSIRSSKRTQHSRTRSINSRRTSRSSRLHVKLQRLKHQARLPPARPAERENMASVPRKPWTFLLSHLPPHVPALADSRSSTRETSIQMMKAVEARTEVRETFGRRPAKHALILLELLDAASHQLLNQLSNQVRSLTLIFWKSPWNHPRTG